MNDNLIYPRFNKKKRTLIPLIDSSTFREPLGNRFSRITTVAKRNGREESKNVENSLRNADGYNSRFLEQTNCRCKLERHY